MPDSPVLAWNAHWVAYADDPREDLGIYVLRCLLDLAEAPEALEVRVSADQRYKLFVGEDLVSFGPQRGDLEHWFFDAVDLGPHLKKGENVVWALVWNFGWQAPMAQITLRTGFLCEAGIPALCTPGDWEIARVPGWDFGRFSDSELDFTGPDERIEGRLLPNWLDLPHMDGLDWRKPPCVRKATSRGDIFEPWWALVPRPIPPMRYEIRAEPPIIRDRVSDSRPQTADRKTPLELIPGVPLLLDYGELLCAYPRLVLQGEPGTEVQITYAEALWLPGDAGKGNRNEVEGKTMHGPGDRVVLGEGPTHFEPLWWRTYRYLQIDVGGKGNGVGNEAIGQSGNLATGESGDQGSGIREQGTGNSGNSATGQLGNSVAGRSGAACLGSSDPSDQSDVSDMSDASGEPGPGATEGREPQTPHPKPYTLTVDALETGYPYAVESSFEADDPWVKPLWDTSIRTARRCAAETYFDCPYYEQLQYVGDTRIQALIHYYLSTDRALPRNAVEQFGWSIMSNGLTQSRYPNRTTQIIPPFSLWWVMMLCDQMLYDTARWTPWWQNEEAGWTTRAITTPRGIEEARPPSAAKVVARAPVTAFSGQQLRAKHDLPTFWNFADWVPTWGAGVPPGGALSTVHALTRRLAGLAHILLGFQASGAEFTDEFRDRAWKGLTRKLDTAHGLVRDQGDPGWTPTEHAEALYRVLQQMTGKPVDPWPTEALEKAGAAKCTYYFSYYKHIAMFGAPEAAQSDRPDGSGGSDRSDRSDGSDTSHRPNRTHKSYKTDRSYSAATDSPHTLSQPADYLTELAPWKEMIENGLSTFAENPEPTRSDCHAWSAHPALGFFQIVAGVTSIAPGWKKAQIMPHPGGLRRFDARIAHPDGDLRVRFEDGRLEIDTPVPALLKWRGKEEELAAGRHAV